MTTSGTRKEQARAWFETLRDRIMAAFEALEDEAPENLYPGAAGRFVKTPWSRGEDEGEGSHRERRKLAAYDKTRPRTNRRRGPGRCSG